MPTITLQDIRNFACRGTNLEIPDKHLFVLLGPTGAGKTTLLNVIAGLVEHEGSVLFNGRDMNRLSANERSVGYLFQDLVLFPHMNVSANIGYSLRVQKWPAAEAERRVNELLSLVRVEHLRNRYPKGLSGGEKQRVALARALAPCPKILLLDEPFNSLDFQTAKYLRLEFLRLHKELDITTIYVTHNLAEAEEMADRIAVILNGTVQQAGPPDEIFFDPKRDGVSAFLGSPNILECTYSKPIAGGLVEVGCGRLSIIVPHEGNQVKKIAILPRDIHVSVDSPPGPDINRFAGVITGIEQTPPTTKLRLLAGDNDLTAEMPYHIYQSLDLHVAKKVVLILKLRWLRVC